MPSHMYNDFISYRYNFFKNSLLIWFETHMCDGILDWCNIVWNDDTNHSLSLWKWFFGAISFLTIPYEVNSKYRFWLQKDSKNWIDLDFHRETFYFFFNDLIWQSNWCTDLEKEPTNKVPCNNIYYFYV